VSGGIRLPVRVVEVVEVNALVKRFRFVRSDGQPLPAFSGGAHTVVEMDDHGRRRMNPYSLMSDPADTSGYEISVRRDDQGRGGSLYMHQHVRPGMEMRLSLLVNLFPLDSRARKHLMLAGGIGITPFLAQIAQLSRTGGWFELHYAARSSALASYLSRLATRHPGQVHGYFDDRNERIDLPRLLGTQPIGTHLYVCGPQGMIDWVLSAARRMGWPDGALHYEEFRAPATGQRFTVELHASGRTITVGETESLLEAIESAGVPAPQLCRAGACGQCETDVVRAEGTIVHHDHWLTPEQRAQGSKIMPCVSRFEGKVLVIDR